MNQLLAFTAIIEAATGLALVVVPSFATRLLFGAEISDISIVLGRLTGVSLFSLGLACWPGKVSTRGALSGMTTYSVLATLYLGFLGVQGEWVGPLLWPAVVLHTVLTILLGRAWFVNVRSSPRKRMASGE